MELSTQHLDILAAIAACLESAAVDASALRRLLAYSRLDAVARSAWVAPVAFAPLKLPAGLVPWGRVVSAGSLAPAVREMVTAPYADVRAAQRECVRLLDALYSRSSRGATGREAIAALALEQQA